MAWVASGQKLPAGHRTQLMLAVRLHGEAMYCPVPHVPQAVHAGELDADEYDTPFRQSAQVAFCWLVQADARDEPAAHCEQTLGAVEPATQKLLAGHAICAEALGQ